MPDKAALDMLVQTKATPLISSDGSKPDVAFLQAPEPKTEPEVKPGKDETKVEAKTEVKPEPKVEAKEPDDKNEDTTPAPIKREFTKLRNKAREAEERATKLETRLDQALSALEKKGAPAATATESGENDPRPIKTNFDDPDKYDDALGNWHSRQSLRVVRAELKAEETKKANAKAEQDRTEYIGGLQKTWQKARTAFIAEHPDYEEIAESDEIQISANATAAILTQGEDGPRLAYWLAQNPDELERINKLDYATAAGQLGRIAERLTAKPVEASRRVPDPISTIRSGKGSAVKDHNDPKNVDMEARFQELVRKNRPFVPPLTGRPN